MRLCVRMETHFGVGAHGAHEQTHPVIVTVQPALTDRNRLTCFFRFFLALPHILLVGGPIAFALSVGSGDDAGVHWGSAGVLGVVAAVVSFIAWFAIIFGGNYPPGLWNLAAMYVRWRVRAVAYLTLLRDEYPPFGEGPYPAVVRVMPQAQPRDRLTVAFRLILAIPHIICVWLLGIAWAFTTIIAWFAILFTGRYPRALYDFGVGVLRWNARLEVYLLLLRDEYPPFSLD
ncbi:MAG TPA: DUF4389 domain-containing protein [Gemmatimonadaceae bacterium]|nr:DUF4389 domain-containing protein [Gemmatimonadaceae bacterium]